MAQSNISFFGWEFRKKGADDKASLSDVPRSPIVPVKQDGAIEIETWDGPGGGSFSSRPFNTDVFNFKTDQDRITRYRKMIQNPDVSEAVDIIVNDSITVDDTKPPVSIRLDNLKLSSKIKKQINEEFMHLLWLMNFNTDAYEIFRDWYVDGILYYHPIVDGKNGIIELRRIDPLQIKKIREIIKSKDAKGVEIVKAIREYYLYRQIRQNLPSQTPGAGSSTFATPSLISQSNIAVPPDLIVSANSGVPSEDRTQLLGHLHKAIKPLNNLVSVENALIIYRLSRAPERRVFYIDVGNLPKSKAEQAVRDMMNNYRQKMVYDAQTGEVDNMARHTTMIEDFWLPRRGDKGTQVETLPGGQNLGEIEDIRYFKKNLYKSLNIPTGRLEETSSLNIGRVAEMTRDELKFSQFVDRLRKRFSSVFLQLLRLQLSTKNIMTVEEFDEVKEQIQFDFIQNFYIAEQKEFDLLRERIQLANEMEPTIGKYFSRAWVKKNVLKQSDEDIEAIKGEMDTEREEALASGQPYGDAPPPMAPGMEGGPLGAPGAEGMPGMDAGAEEGISDSEGSAILGDINSRLRAGEEVSAIKDELQLDSIVMEGDQAVGFSMQGLNYRKGQQ